MTVTGAETSRCGRTSSNPAHTIAAARESQRVGRPGTAFGSNRITGMPRSTDARTTAMLVEPPRQTTSDTRCSRSIHRAAQ